LKLFFPCKSSSNFFFSETKIKFNYYHLFDLNFSIHTSCYVWVSYPYFYIVSIWCAAVCCMSMSILLILSSTSFWVVPIECSDVLLKKENVWEFLCGLTLDSCIFFNLFWILTFFTEFVELWFLELFLG